MLEPVLGLICCPSLMAWMRCRRFGFRKQWVPCTMAFAFLFCPAGFQNQWDELAA